MPLHISSTCAHHHEVKIALHSLWYHHTYRCDDTRGCVMQFWAPYDEHMCSKHVEAWNKLIVKQKYCESSWLITEINILYVSCIFVAHRQEVYCIYIYIYIYAHIRSIYIYIYVYCVYSWYVLCWKEGCLKLFKGRPMYISWALCWWRSWLRHCATSRKVEGSIPDGVTGIFHWHNPSGHTMALGLTQSLTEMSTRNISWVKAAGA